MARSINNLQFWDSLRDNNSTFLYYFNYIKMLAASRFKWTGLPDTVNIRYFENLLFERGSAVYYQEDKDIIGFVCLPVAWDGPPDIYGEPTEYEAIAVNGLTRKFEAKNNDSVIIYNNTIKEPSDMVCRMFARRLYECDRTQDINIVAQKTPVLIMTDEKQRLTMAQVYQKYMGNQPVIFGNKKAFDADAVKVLNTQAPFVADKIAGIKNNIWADILNYLGILAPSYAKRERENSIESSASVSAAYAARQSFLKTREEACDKIRKIWGGNPNIEFVDETMLTANLPVSEEGEGE